MKKSDLSPVARAVVDGLVERLVHECSLNAASGYLLTPGLPSPEVFERPGWEILVAEPETARVEVFREVDPIPARRTEEEPRPYNPLQMDTVTPVVGATLSHPGAPRYLGLGFHVPSRRYVLFSSDRGTFVREDGR